MPINANHEDLAQGEPPDPEATRLLLPLAEAWYQEYLDGGNDDRAFAVPGTRYRASWAGGCARALSYKVLHNDAKTALTAFPEEPTEDELATKARLLDQRDWFAPTNPPTIAEAWRMNLGQLVHERFQEVFERAYPGARCEVSVDLRDEIDGSASVDILLEQTYDDSPSSEPFKRTLIELKTINGFGFKISTTSFKGPAEGPRHGAKIQASLAGYALDVDEVVIGYLSMENVSPELAAGLGVGEVGRFLAGWSYSREEYRPIAEAEHKRVAKVLELLDEGFLAPRAIADPEIPKAARITNPETGAWTVADTDGKVLSAGKTWWCGYCWHRDRCLGDGEGQVPVAIGAHDA